MADEGARRLFNPAGAAVNRGTPPIGGQAFLSPPRFWCSAVALGLIAAIAFHFIPDLPVGIPYDEPKKGRFILTGWQDFHHPILMLQIVRLANLWTHAQDLASAVELGRSAASASGGLLVFATVAFARRVVGPVCALGAGILAAVVPLTVFHAQLFKEDIFVAPWLILGLLALDLLGAAPTPRHAVSFGAAAGLAAAAKYIGVVLVPLALVLPILARIESRSRYYGMVGLAIALGFTLFCAINAPLFLQPDVFFGGLQGEVTHALIGHLIVHHGWHSGFVFTWTENLWPGLGAPLALGGILGALWIASCWRTSPPALRLLLAFGLVWYLMHELSPMKPFPEGARHMVVMSAVFAIMAMYAIERLADATMPHRRPFAAAATFALAAGPAWASFELARSAANDTHLVVERVVAALGEPTAWARTIALRRQTLWLDLSQPIEIIENAAQFAVINELFAREYVRSTTLGGQPEDVRKIAAGYAALLERPGVTIASTAGSYAYRNTPYRIVVLQGSPTRLAAAVASIGPMPDIEFRLLPNPAGR
jgi:Dolichyl-phosphate-mannose-protein mannosyltransferase